MTIATAEFHTQADAESNAAAMNDGELVVVDKKTEIIEEPPPLPYDTATLLEDAAMILQWKAEQTMRIAQTLFEGIDLYGSHSGLITYHRTDSQQVVPEAQEAARQVIVRLYGKDALPPKPLLVMGADASRVNLSPTWLTRFTTFIGHRTSDANQQSKIENQHSHEAIRPTVPERLPDSLQSHLEDDPLTLYRLIWERFIASQMKAAKVRVTTVEVETA
jgi:DNA topoisomerase-1